MKKLIHPLLYSLCSAVLTVSLISCTLTAFSVDTADYFQLCAYTLITVAVFTVLSVAVKSKRMFAGGASVLVMLYIIVLAFIRDSLWRSAVSFINIILRRLHYAYSWINPVKQAAPAGVNLFIICAAVLLAVIITICLVRLRRLLPAVLVSAAAVMPCYIVRDTPPGALPVTVCTVIILALFMTRFLHRMNISAASGALVSCAAAALAAALIINSVSENPSGWANNIAEKLPGLGGRYKTTDTGIDFNDKVDLTGLDDLDLNNLDEVEVKTTVSDSDIYLKDTAYSNFNNNVWSHNTTGGADLSGCNLQDMFGLSDSYMRYFDYSLSFDTIDIHSLIERSRSLYPYLINTYDGFRDSFTTYGDVGVSSVNGADGSCSYNVNTNSIFELQDDTYVINNSYAEYAEENYAAVPEGISDVVSTSSILSRVKDNASLSEKVLAVYDYFTELNGRYTLTDGKIPENTDYLKWFTEKKEGWCIHYATAAALILRELGVPSRYAVGYKIYVPSNHISSEKITITQQSRHAWAEYYDALYGWQTLDVTPGQGSEQDNPGEAPPGGTAEESTAPSTAQPSTAAPDGEKPAGSEATTANPAAEATAPKASENPADSGNSPNSSGIGGNSGALNAVIAVLISLAAVLAAVMIIFLRRRLILGKVHRRLYEQDYTRGSIEAYRYAQKLSKRLKEKIPDKVTQAAEKAKFSSGGAEHGDFKTITAYCNNAVRRLEKSASPLKKLYYKFVLCLY